MPSWQLPKQITTQWVDTWKLQEKSTTFVMTKGEDADRDVGCDDDVEEDDNDFADENVDEEEDDEVKLMQRRYNDMSGAWKAAAERNPPV